MKTSRKLALAVALGAMGAAGGIGASAPANAATILSTSWEHRNFGGSRLNHTLSADGFFCTDSGSNIDASDSSFSADWNNRISSWRAYSNCAIKAYSSTGFGGTAMADFWEERSDLGSWDNIPKSYRWS